MPFVLRSASYYTGDRRHFPEGTRGFLYYCQPNPGAPLVAGQIRFRLTPGNDPASFIQGSDLLMPNGLPWSIPLLMIAGEKIKDQGDSATGIWQQLVDDGLVTPTLLETWGATMKASKLAPIPSSRIIHSFGQLFHVDFDLNCFYFFLLTMNQLRRQRYYGLFTEYEDHPIIRPYLGSALCCFERSILPQHNGTRTVVIRIVKMISPPICVYPDYNGCIPLPVEGELVHYHYKRWGLQPKSYNVDSPGHASLKMLFRDES
ncbi:hypothetical protein PILCRDRAFT_820866 [Piloderma croceum F 1598]|uniref:Uncharacterized protein n=1 Tax=Piloderma croceum (strain F 1598) TaxID=765440 RepID=A0A0C3EGB2_PILCF|nr:hypothetical protein PILCRDRAFT_830199 [Piloderma croceum F 1598]KIM81981.1 hypothetical protein PILCRDRAFT_820866 [Piloderma croceum F 1598]